MKTNGKQTKNKGIVLITTMLLLTIIIMIVTLMTMSAHQGLKLGVSYSDGEQAYYAALSGLEYARARVHKAQDWQKTSEPYSKWNTTKEWNDPDSAVVDKILETDGTVTGYFGWAGENNYKSKFVIAFDRNNADGMKYISCNNFAGTSDGETYLADSEGKNYNLYKNVNSGKIHIISKGVAGNTVRYAEALIDAHANVAMDTASMARANIDVTLSGHLGIFNITNAGSLSGKPASIRSAEKINITTLQTPYKPLVLENSGIAHAEEVNLSYNGVTSPYDISIERETISQTNQFLGEIENELTWPKLSNVSGKTLNSGAYLYIETEKEWKFFDSANIKNIDKNGSLTLNTNVGVSLIGNDSFVLDNYPATDKGLSNMPRMTIKESLVCDGPLYIGYVASLQKKLEGYTANLQSLNRVNVRFEGEREGDSPILRVAKMGGVNETFDGSVYIQGELTGSGKLISQNSIYFQAGSFFDTQKNSSVSVYAEQDVKILPSTTTETLTALSSFFTGEIKDKDGNVVYSKLWEKFVAEMNEQIDKGNLSTNQEEVADKLLAFEGNAFDNMLLNFNLKDKVERRLFAQAIIANNSAIVGGGAAPGGATDYNEFKICPTFKSGYSIDISPGDPLATPIEKIIKINLIDDVSNMIVCKIKLTTDTVGWKIELLDAPGNSIFPAISRPDLSLAELFDVSNYTSVAFAIKQKLSDDLDALVASNVPTASTQSSALAAFLKAKTTLSEYDLIFRDNIPKDFVAAELVYTIDPDRVPEQPSDSALSYVQLTDKFGGFLDVNNTIIRGMVFTRNGKFYADVAGDSLTVRGGIISNGVLEKNEKGLEIYTASNVNFCYDPDYMAFLPSSGASSSYNYIFVFGN